MHNASYDVGCLLVLFKQFNYEDSWYKKAIFYDTVLMAKLVDQDQFSYSLENCSKRYGGVEKSKATLTDYVWNSGLYQNWYKEVHDINKKTRPTENLLFNYAITHLNELPEHIVGEYCNYDVESTWSLFKVLKKKLDLFASHFNLEDYSTMIKVCLDIKRTGIRVDIPQAIKTKELLTKMSKDIEQDIYDAVGYQFNINSSRQLVEALKAVGLSEFAKTPTGNDSASAEWLKEQSHDICQKIIKYKNYNKLCNEFLTKIVTYQEIHTKNGSTQTRVFPNFNILGAAKTGRMSSSGYRGRSMELNLQQIPKRGEDKEAARYVRAIFIADENETWIGADYSNQEQRLQIEFAKRLNLPAVDEILLQLKKDPYSDIHQVIADICKVERTAAKGINLGLSYSMGERKLCKMLGLPTRWCNTRNGIQEVAGAEGRAILDRYHEYLPFMKELQKVCTKNLQTYGFITTIDGRRLYLDKAIMKDGKWQTFEYKGMSKLVQGSAAGVTMKALINCYQAGLNIKLAVHDEIGITSKNVEADKKTLVQCMENTFDFSVPMVVEVSEGQSWAD